MVSLAEFSKAWVRGCFPSLTNSSCHNACKPLTQKQMHKELRFPQQTLALAEKFLQGMEKSEID